MKRLAIALLPFCVAACSVLQAKPDITRNYLLSAQPPASTLGRSDLALAIGPITLPAYLDRAEIVTRVRSNEIELSTVHRWAEPLKSNFARVLTSDIAAVVGTNRIVEFPWFGKPEVDYRVTVDVERLEATDGGIAVLVAAWRLRVGLEGDVLKSERSTHSVPIEGARREDSVAALSKATGMLAQEIAETIPPSP